MKTLNFNKKSLHYKLASFADDFYEPAEDICRYTRQVIFGFLRLIAYTSIFIIFVTLFSQLLVGAIFGIIFSIYYGEDLFTEAGLSDVYYMGL